MSIKIARNSGRRAAWTDKKDGYVELLFAEGTGKNGYYRGERRYAGGFSLDGVPVTDADFADIFPQGCSADFGGKKWEGSLLLDEQAMFFHVRSDARFAVEIKDIVPLVPAAEEAGAADDSAGAESAERPESDGAADSDDAPAHACVPMEVRWRQSSADNCTVVSADCGIAVAAPFPFSFAVDGRNLVLSAEPADCGYSSGGSAVSSGAPSFPTFQADGWYLVFEDTEEAAVAKALRLVQTRAEERHCAAVSAFLEKAAVHSGDARFDESVQWARFSAWMLATKDHGAEYRGIWAGLPWFRDNWGRDTFISLCGCLLASGCFDEARDVLLGFAGFQDMRPESPTFGRIPNRYRNAEDVIYNTADGTLWFIRALWEYAQYSGDVETFRRLRGTVETAIDADIARTDGHGFLKHGDADTWMDARIRGKEPWSARGDRANDVQALWFSALKIGAFLLRMEGASEKAEAYDRLAEKVKDSFAEFFWNEDCRALADRLPPGGYGEWAKDMRVRPNQLFAITAPSILPCGAEERGVPFVAPDVADAVLENVSRELVNLFGLFSLSPEDPIFHPEHENPAMHNKDAAYHNGTIWEWTSGAYISAAALHSCGTLPAAAGAILQNEAKLILDWGCAGSLSENIHARPDADGNPKLSGTFSQAWSLAEYVRAVCQDVAGFVPRLLENRLEFRPCLPAGCDAWSARLPFGKGWTFCAEIRRRSGGYDCDIEWRVPAAGGAEIPALCVNGAALLPNKKTALRISGKSCGAADSAAAAKGAGGGTFGCPARWISEPFAAHDLSPEWNGAEHQKDYLEKLVLSGRMLSTTCGGENTAALEWYFDSAEFKEKYLTDAELGALYSAERTEFRLWAPTARQVLLLLYPDGADSAVSQKIAMTRRSDAGFCGVWTAAAGGDLHGVYYEYAVLVHGVWNHSADPYAHACGVNGGRSMVVDLSRTNPDGWESVSAPAVRSPSDVVAYEVHVADVSSSPSWNGPESLRRLYGGAAFRGTSVGGVASGFDHIKELGVTHVQLLPVFDFRSVDEARTHDAAYAQKIKDGLFNWGYDPENYGVPEGSYSSNPYDGAVRIRDLKSLVKAFADEGIGVVMDVVFNHVNDGLHQALGVCVPGYFFRVEGFSGAGEDTASEREMFRKYMVDMLCYWLKEYKLSGFRFDLMGLHDVVTMNEIDAALRRIKGDVLVYGEGWAMYDAGKMVPASMCNAVEMPRVGHFNDAIRCAVKGPVFSDGEPGFIHNGSRREAVKFGIVGATAHPQVDAELVEGTANPNPWGEHTWLSVNYTEIHDNFTLNDKLRLVEPGRPESYYEQMQKMAVSLILLAQGMPILHAGMEFLRTKEIPADILRSGEELYDVAWLPDKSKAFLRNSYNICDRINALDWTRCAEKRDVVAYVRELIALRRAHPAFRMADAPLVAEALAFVDNLAAGLPEPVLAWRIDGGKCGDSWKRIFVIANPVSTDVKFALPADGAWRLVTDGVEFSDGGAAAALDSGAVVSVRPKTVAVFAGA
ncbi:MAG: type I pullulanase [Treponemataceae bacterium]|nr:type I pullulanase [Treponemataceae bacterium]